MLSVGDNLVPPSENPESYCRLCFSMDSIRTVTHSSKYVQENLVPLANKQIGIFLVPDEDFPCALCRVCQEKLEELYLYNFDGLLDEYNDEDLVRFKSACRAVDSAIRRTRASNNPVAATGGDKRVVLPFHQLGDGRYKCNVCPHEVFEFISACIKHYQEVHPVSTLSDIAAEPDNSAFQGDITKKQSFNCVTCAASFNHIDDLIAHRATHSQGESLIEPRNISRIDRLNKPKISVKCVKCHRVFDNVYDLIEHREAHMLNAASQPQGVNAWLIDPLNVTDENAYKCSYCHEAFVEPKPYYFHLNVVHNMNMCDFCGTSCSAASVLIRHKTGHRKPGDFKCFTCAEQFTTAQEVEEHMLHHQTLISEVIGEPTLTPLPTCSGCFTAFATTEELSLHVAVCTSEMVNVDDEDVLILPDDSEEMVGESSLMIIDDEI